MTQSSTDLPPEATSTDDSARCGICGRVRAALRQSWRTALTAGLLLGTIAVGLVWWNYTPEYEAEAKLRIKSKRPYIAFMDRGYSDVFVRTQLRLLRTRAILSPALEDILRDVPKVKEMEDPLSWMEQGIRAEVIAGSEIVAVRFSDPDPETAETVLEAVVHSYMQYHRRYDRMNSQGIVSMLNEEKTRREKVVIELQNEVRDRAQKIRAGEPDAFVAQLREELRRARIDEGIGQAELQAFQASAEESVEDYRQQLDGEFGEQAAAEARRKQLAAEQELKAKLRSLTSRRTVLEEAVNNENRRMEKERPSQADLVDLEFAQAELDRQQEIYDKIASRVIAMQTEEVAPARVEEVDEAKLSEEPIEGLPIWKMIWSGLAGFLLPFGLLVAIGLLRCGS